MKITIHQALYGEKEKAWDLLKTTLSDNVLAKKIAHQTDLQDSPPSGISWQPAIRGFLFGEHYLVIKTYLDTSSDVRNGRVFSHCLIIDKKDLAKISDLAPLFKLFSHHLFKSIPLNTLVIDFKQVEKTVLLPNVELRFNRIVQAFLKFVNKTHPIVWVSQDDYEVVVSRLWQMLSPQQREEFNFGINFNPNEVAKDRLSFIAIPENLDHKFSNKGFLLIKKEDRHELVDFAEQFIAGHENAINRINEFIGSIEASEPSTEAISAIAKGIPTYENLSAETDLKKLNTLSHIIATYSPKEQQGTKVKSQVLSRISSLIATSDKSDIWLLRNFKVKSFKGAEALLSKAVEKWMHKYLLNERENNLIDFTGLIADVIALPKTNWIYKSLRSSLKLFFDITHVKTSIVWRWVTINIDLLEALDIPGDDDLELAFCATVPKFEASASAKIKSYCVTRHWFQLFATIVKSELSFDLALTAWLEVVDTSTNSRGLDTILDGVDDGQIIEAAIDKADKRLLKIAGELCRRNPANLNNLIPDNTTWQEVWLQGIENGNSLSAGIINIRAKVETIFSTLIANKSVNVKLLAEIGKSEFANVLHYKNRADLWRWLPASVKEKFLKKTAAAFFEAFTKNPGLSVPADRDLNTYIFTAAFPVFLNANRNNIKIVLPLFYIYPNLPEHLLRDYLRGFNGALDYVSAAQLGKLVYNKNFGQVASLIFSRCRNNKQYRRVLVECAALLNFMDRGFAFLAGWVQKKSISEEDWWASLTEIAYSLYSGGPMDNKIWTQAGGKDFDLLTKGTGKEVWIAAVQKLRKKEVSGEIKAKKLLNAMLEEHRNNETLKTLKSLWNKI